MTPARSALLAAHRSLIGLQGEPLAAALIPTANAAVRAGVDALSTCELEAAAAIRLAFALPASLDPPAPYVPGGDHAARALYTLTGGGLPWAVVEGGALRVPTLDEPPEVGDGIWYAPAPGHPEHVDGGVCEVEGLDAVAEGDPSTQLRVRAIAGGQPNGRGHSSAIAEVERVLVWQGGRWVDRATGRPVWCVIDGDVLGERYAAREG